MVLNCDTCIIPIQIKINIQVGRQVGGIKQVGWLDQLGRQVGRQVGGIRQVGWLDQLGRQVGRQVGWFVGWLVKKVGKYLNFFSSLIFGVKLSKGLSSFGSSQFTCFFFYASVEQSILLIQFSRWKWRTKTYWITIQVATKNIISNILSSFLIL